MQQFLNVKCQYGAPMGRASWPTKPTEAKSVRLFRVNLNSGGYDDGGAYWGLPRYNLWCATDDANYRDFVRAPTRAMASKELNIEHLLKRKTV